MSDECALEGMKQPTKEKKDQLTSQGISEEAVVLLHPLHPPIPNPPAPEEPSLSQIATTLRHLSTTVARLSSENESQTWKLAQLSSTVARLSSENEELKRRDEEHRRVTLEVSNATLPNGHWTWEAGRSPGDRGKGRYRWSRNHIEHESHLSHLIRKSDPPPSLATIPVELLDAILSILPRPDVLRLCGVSFKLLERASIKIYATGTVVMTSREASTFVLARLKEPYSLEDRITPLLVPSRLSLTYRSFKSKHLAHLSRIGRHLPSLPIDLLILERDPKIPSFSIERWSPFLWFLNPQHVHYGSNDGEEKGLPPTISHVHRHTLAAAQRWTRLTVYVGKGIHSVPLIADGEEFGFSGVMRAVGEVRAAGLLRSFEDQKESKLEIVDERDIEVFLKALPERDPSVKSRSFVVALLAESAGGFLRVPTLD